MSANASPRLVATLDKVKATKVGTLSLQSNQAGAMALVDDKRVGPLPVSTLVLAGKHRVRLDVEGASERTVTVVGGRITDVALDAVVAAAPATVTAPAPEPKKRSVALPVVLIAAGGVIAVSGTSLFATSFSWQRGIGELDIAQAHDAFVDAQTRHDVGIAGMAIGGAALIAGVVVLIAGSGEPPPVAVAPIAGGAMVSAGGRF